METKTKINVNENGLIFYNAVFIDKTWRIGTKNDPNKEYGLIKFNIEVKLSSPKDDGTDSYVQTIEEFVFEKDQFPTEHIDRYSSIKVGYLPPVGNPQGKMRFVKLMKANNLK